MAKKKETKDLQKRAAQISTLQSVVWRSEDFLNTAKHDRDRFRGSFSAAAQASIGAGLLTDKSFEQMGIKNSKEIFNALANGEKVKGIPTEVKRTLLQGAQDTAKQKLITDFGVHVR